MKQKSENLDIILRILGSAALALLVGFLGYLVVRSSLSSFGYDLPIPINDIKYISSGIPLFLIYLIIFFVFFLTPDLIGKNHSFSSFFHKFYIKIIFVSLFCVTLTTSLFMYGLINHTIYECITLPIFIGHSLFTISYIGYQWRNIFSSSANNSSASVKILNYYSLVNLAASIVLAFLYAVQIHQSLPQNLGGGMPVEVIVDHIPGNLTPGDVERFRDIETGVPKPVCLLFRFSSEYAFADKCEPIPGSSFFNRAADSIGGISKP